MAIIKREVPREWRGPVYVTKDHYEIWAAVPMKLGSIRKSGAYWFTPDGMRFVSSQDASEYMLRLHRAQGPTSKVAEAVARAAKEIEPKKQVPTRVENRTLPNRAVSAQDAIPRDVKLQQLLDMVRELQKESNSAIQQVQKKQETGKKLVP